MSSLQAAIDPGTELLIDQLPQVSQLGYGYSTMFSGAQFLPEPDSSQVHTLVLGSQAPSNSPVLDSIVRKGFMAVPSLLKHLDDSRPTKIPQLSGMMWMSFADEYDYNRRLRKVAPAGVNKDTFGQNQPSAHTITVGDLCFVALGQIVNRNFNASRYQPTGGLVVNSPTYSKRLCKVVRADFEGLTEKMHRELLIQDLQMPDHEDRRVGACRRIAFYYPGILEPLVLKQLAVPTFDGSKIHDFLNDKLYRAKSKESRQALFDEFLRVNGQAFSDGILLQLFHDLDMQEADEQRRLHPPLKEKLDARSLLIQLYGFDKRVSSTNQQYTTAWDRGQLAGFVSALAGFKSLKVDEVVYRVFTTVGDDDYLAMPCMERLSGGAYDEEFRRYCQRRIPQSDYQEDALRKVLSKIDANKSKGTLRRDTTAPPSTPGK